MPQANDDVLVTQLLGCGVLSDGTVAEMTLKKSDGRIQVLRFSPTTMLGFVNSVFELFLNEKMQKEQALGYSENAAPSGLNHNGNTGCRRNGGVSGVSA